MHVLDTYIVNQLHTDQLIEKYGSVNISVIKHERNLRISELKDGNGILRTYAITLFPSVIYSGKVQAIHEVVKNGSAIGQTIKNFGFDIAKKTITNFVIDTPSFFSNRSTLTSCQLSEIHCFTGSEYEYYAEVCEIFCPTFKSLNVKTEFENTTISEKIKHILSLANINSKKIILTL